MKNSLKTALSLVAIATISACGGGGSSSGPSTPAGFSTCAIDVSAFGAAYGAATPQGTTISVTSSLSCADLDKNLKTALAAGNAELQRLQQVATAADARAAAAVKAGQASVDAKQAELNAANVRATQAEASKAAADVALQQAVNARIAAQALSVQAQADLVNAKNDTAKATAALTVAQAAAVSAKANQAIAEASAAQAVAAKLVAETAAATAQAQIVTLNAQIVTLKAQVATGSGDVVALNAKIKKLQDDLAAAVLNTQTQVAALQVQLTAANAALAAAPTTAAMATAQAALTAAQAQIVTLNAQIVTLQAQVATGGGDVVALNAQIKKLQEDLVIANTIASNNAQAAQSMTAQILILNGQIASLQTQLAAAGSGGNNTGLPFCVGTPTPIVASTTFPGAGTACVVSYADQKAVADANAANSAAVKLDGIYFSDTLFMIAETDGKVWILDQKKPDAVFGAVNVQGSTGTTFSAPSSSLGANPRPTVAVSGSYVKKTSATFSMAYTPGATIQQTGLYDSAFDTALVMPVKKMLASDFYTGSADVEMTVTGVGATFTGREGTCTFSGTFGATTKGYNKVSITWGANCTVPTGTIGSGVIGLYGDNFIMMTNQAGQFGDVGFTAFFSNTKAAPLGLTTDSAKALQASQIGAR